MKLGKSFLIDKEKAIIDMGQLTVEGKENEQVLLVTKITIPQTIKNYLYNF